MNWLILHPRFPKRGALSVHCPIAGNKLRTFTGGSLNGPNCVAFDSGGNIYVSSALTSSVMKFDSGENFVMSFTGGGLSSPMSIARDPNDVLYVSGGGSNNIVKFDTGGNYLGAISHPDLPGPQGVAFDERGHLFSTSFYLNNIVEFDADEVYVQTITSGGLLVPRSVAFRPLDNATAIDEPNALGPFELYQNVPNPFNPVTRIHYSVPAGGGHIELTVIDVSGRRVRTLIDGARPSGAAIVEWNGRDDSGRTLPAGAYFVKITTATQGTCGRITLLR